MSYGKGEGHVAAFRADLSLQCLEMRRGGYQREERPGRCSRRHCDPVGRDAALPEVRFVGAARRHGVITSAIVHQQRADGAVTRAARAATCDAAKTPAPPPAARSAPSYESTHQLAAPEKPTAASHML